MSGYIGTQPVPQSTQTRDSFTATSGQTSFATGGYQSGYIDLYLNGIKLAAADYTATNNSDVVLAVGAATGDILEVVAYTAFNTANVTGAVDFTVTGLFTSRGIDDNADATAITIDSSENVGINTATPLSTLQVRDSGSENGSLRVGGSGASLGLELTYNQSGATTSIIQANPTYTNVGTLLKIRADGDANPDQLVLTGAGNVGIGTSSPTGAGTILHLNGSSTVADFHMTNTTSGVASTDGFIMRYSGLNAEFLNREAGASIFYTSATERMRLDSSGHLLFAKTSTSSGVAGIRFAGDAPGYAEFTRDGGNPLFLNRETSDGDIIRFAKDNSTVGSIGGSANVLSIVGKDGNGGIAIQNNSFGDIVYPASNTTGGASNGAIDLGYNNGRWKDLYLSGGVYLGGTGSANKLDDFETGSFTATLVGYYSSPTTAVTTTGYYTKVGNTVDIYINFESANTSGASGDMWVTGIPFASSGVYSVLPCEMNAAGTYPNSSPFGLLAGAICYFYKHVSNGNATAVAHNAGTSRSVRVTGNYRVA
jgi:hypothetical protein